MKKEFQKAVEFSKRLILDDQDLIKNIELIALLGSVDDKEAVFNYSDVDLLIMPKTNKFGRVPLSIIKNLKEKAKTASKKFPDMKLSFLTFTKKP